MRVLKYFLLIIPFILTVIMKIVVFFGFIRLQFPISEELDIDMGYIVTNTSRWLNQFWDIVLGRFPHNQPHHEAKDLFSSAFVGTLKTLWLLVISLMPWSW